MFYSLFNQTGQTYRQVLAFNGTTRSCLLHLPPASSVKGQLPLVLAFHGAGENGLLMSGRGISPIADQVGFIVVYPDGSNQTGNVADGFTWNANFCCGYASQNKPCHEPYQTICLKRLSVLS